MLADPAPASDEVLSAGGAPPEGGELDAGETGVEGLTLTEVDAVGVCLGLAVVDGVAVAGQWVPVAGAAFLLPVALVLAFAEAVMVPLLVAVAVAFAVAVAVLVAVLVAVAVPLSLELALPLAGLSLGLLLVLLGGLVAGLAGGTLGVTDLVGLAAADDEEAGRHAGAVPLLWPGEVRPWLAPPPGELPRLPDPARLGTPPLVLEEEIPTAELSWPKASRSGGTARATPMANTTQAAARAGRSSPYRQSRGAPPLPAPPLPAVSWPPRTAFQRRTRSARKPPRAEAPECLLA